MRTKVLVVVITAIVMLSPVVLYYVIGVQTLEMQGAYPSILTKNDVLVFDRAQLLQIDTEESLKRPHLLVLKDGEEVVLSHGSKGGNIEVNEWFSIPSYRVSQRTLSCYPEKMVRPITSVWMTGRISVTILEHTLYITPEWSLKTMLFGYVVVFSTAVTLAIWYIFYKVCTWIVDEVKWLVFSR